MKDGKIIRHVPRSHPCMTPGWWQRRKLDIGSGSVWKCSGCAQEWEWSVNYAGSGWFRRWQNF